MNQEVFEVTARNVFERPQTFSFLWEAFFGARKRMKLTQEDVTELQGFEAVTKPWTDTVERLNGWRMNPDGCFQNAISNLIADPSPQNVDAILGGRWVPPYSGLQLSNAIAQVENFIHSRRAELIAPVVRKHLKRIHGELLKESQEQGRADAQALVRLGPGTATGGETGALRTLRERTEEVAGLLDRDDAGLTDWRNVLGGFLP